MIEITIPGLTFIIGVLVGLCIGLGYCAYILYQDTQNLRRHGNQLRMINAHLKRKGQRAATGRNGRTGAAPMTNLYCKECDALTTPTKPGEPLHPCSDFTDDGEPIYACESYLSEHLPVLSNEALTAELNEAKAKITDMKKWLQQIALVNCTCDYELDINPAAHDLYCMYRVMTGYETEQEEPQ